MHEHESASEFLKGLESGEESAFERLYREFADRLLRLAEREIGRRLRQVYPPEDAMASALGSFYRRAADGRDHFDHSGGVWALLSTITTNKIRRAAQKYRPELFADIEVDHVNGGALAREPTHEEVVEHADAIEAFLAKFKPRDADILRLWLEGHRSVEIAKKVRVSVATVNRVLRPTRDLIRQQMEMAKQRWPGAP